MLIQCGPRFVQLFRVTLCPTAGGPREGARWWSKVGTLVSWDRNKYGIGRGLCDVQTDAARVGMVEHASWLHTHERQHYQEWYDRLPLKQICAILPVYLYEDNQVTRVAVEPFQAPVNVAGQCGWIYCTNKSVTQRWSLKYAKLPERRSKAVEFMTAEINELDRWLRDGAYMWTVEYVANTPGVRSGQLVASDRGFYGFNPWHSGMMDSIPEQYKHLLEAWCNERGLSRP